MNILVIAPSFPPINAPDGHRMRHFMQYANGSNQYVVLTMRPEQVAFPVDEYLLQGISERIKVIRLAPKSFNWPKVFRINNRVVQSISAFYEAILKVHKQNKIDLIICSSTSYPITYAAFKARRKLGIPYVVDMQDPWRSDHYLKVPASQRPAKFWFSYVFDAILERVVLPNAAGFITVNPKYVSDIIERYALKPMPSLTLSFAASLIDFEIAKALPQEIKKDERETIQIVYVGRINYSMHKSFDLFFEILKLIKENGIHFSLSLIGTSYSAKPDKESNVDYLIEKHHLQNSVKQEPNRIGYFQSLRYLMDADVLFLPSSSDQKYNPSKWANVLASNTSIITELSIPHRINSSQSFFHLNSNLSLNQLARGMKDFLQIDNLRKKADRELPSSFFADEHARKLELFLNEVIASEQKD
jgi:glycosyltransferase involved in cell wall biosynthesis